MSWALIPVTPALSCALLVAGTTGLLPQLTALGAAVATSTGVHAVLLGRLALSAHLRRRTARACRSAGLLGMSLLVTGATVVAATAAEPDPAARASLRDPFAARLGVAGLVLATLLFLLGLLLPPGPESGPGARSRRALDGLAIGACLLYASWLMVVRPRDGAHPLAVGVALLGCAGLAIATVTGMRAARYRPAMVACSAGAALSITGLGTTVTILAGAAPTGWLPMATLALVFAPVLCWAGALAGDRSAPSPGAPPAGPDRPDGPDAEPAPVPAARTDHGFAGYPILAVPVGTALAATAYRVAGGQPFGTVPVGLGLGVLVALAVRECFAVRDIRRYARGIAEQEARYRALVSGSGDITVVLDSDLVVTWQSPASARQFGLRDQDVLDHPFTALVHPDDAGAVRERLASVLSDRRSGQAPALLPARLRDGSGRWRDTESTVSNQRAVPEIGALVVHVRDIGERRELERVLHRMSLTDRLTDLPNRRQLLRTLAAMRAVPGQPGTLLLIALDGPAVTRAEAGAGVAPAGSAQSGREVGDTVPVGDTMPVGDTVLVEVARRLRETIAASDLPARLSGTEFAVATADHPVRAYALASRVLAALDRPYQVSGAAVRLTGAVGLAELAAADSVKDALSRAELAARRAGQLRTGDQSRAGRIEWYDEALEADLRRRSTLEEELPGVVARGELDLVFQPILDLVEDVPVGAEALLRWRHPTRGTVAAADFVPVAEDLGLIDEIGEWVLHRACRQLAAWLRDGLDLWMSVNLTARQLAAPNLVARVGRILDNHQLPAERLVLEVTEQCLGPAAPGSGTHGSATPGSGALGPHQQGSDGQGSDGQGSDGQGSDGQGSDGHDTDRQGADRQGAVAQLTGLRALGVRTALAKFGTGPTPLASLRRLPVDVLKVDWALFAGPVGKRGRSGVVTDPGTAAAGPGYATPTPLIEVVVGLGRRLGLEIVAEGLEDEAQVDLVRAGGCRYGQGFLLGRPEPAEHFEAYLENHRSPTA